MLLLLLDRVDCSTALLVNRISTIHYAVLRSSSWHTQ
jgi:hypothetical protein